MIASRFWASGSCGAIAGPKIAHTIQNSSTIAPMMNDGERRSWRSKLTANLAATRLDRGGRLDRDVDDAHSAARSRMRGLSTENRMSAASVTTM